MENNYRLERLDAILNEDFCPQAFESFLKLIDLKKDGYSSYPESFLPFRGIDLHSINYLLYENDIPFATLRNINITAFKAENLTAPIEELIMACPDFKVRYAFNHHLKLSLEMSSPLIYSSNFTIRTSHRSRELPFSKEAKEIMAAATAFDYLSLKSSGIICGAVKKFKTEPLFHSWGYEPLTYKGQELDYFEKKGTGGEEVKIMLMNKPSELSISYLKKWEFLFSEMMVCA